jgi:hypothetical protein
MTVENLFFFQSDFEYEKPDDGNNQCYLVGSPPTYPPEDCQPGQTYYQTSGFFLMIVDLNNLLIISNIILGIERQQEILVKEEWIILELVPLNAPELHVTCLVV